MLLLPIYQKKCNLTKSNELKGKRVFDLRHATQTLSPFHESKRCSLIRHGIESDPKRILCEIEKYLKSILSCGTNNIRLFIMTTVKAAVALLRFTCRMRNCVAGKMGSRPNRISHALDESMKWPSTAKFYYLFIYSFTAVFRLCAKLLAIITRDNIEATPKINWFTRLKNNIFMWVIWISVRRALPTQILLPIIGSNLLNLFREYFFSFDWSQRPSRNPVFEGLSCEGTGHNMAVAINAKDVRNFERLPCLISRFCW